nr:uncharacterized protein LOC117680486 [Crassostrea gigas]
MADIEQMFYRFLVTEDHRDFLRFFWYHISDPNEELIEYRMKVHVFRNTPSPAVAMYGLQKTVENADDDVKSYVFRNFYVDDGITTVPNSSEAVKLLKKTQSVLYEEGKIRLHKIASNSLDVIIHFPMEDLEKNLNSIDIGTDYQSTDLPMQQSLAVAYLYAVDEQDNINVGFIMGKSKVAPSSGHTIPRLEWCGAVLATELSEKITNNLDLPSNSIKFFTDSKVVLGYFNNRSRRFYNYVSDRVSIIHQRSKSEQWNYVSTGNNPADIGTRPGKSVQEVMDKWISGPNKPNISLDEDFSLIEPESDKEIKSVVKKTSVQQFIADRFVKFSTWPSLVCAFRLLRRRCLHKIDKDRTFPKESVEESHETELFILRSSQRLSFKEEINCLKDSTPLPRKSALIQLNPFLDKDGILRVGGRLSQSPLPINQKHPIIIDRKSHAAILLVRHYHEKIQHQGRVFTEGALRSHGFWIIGAKKIINSVLHKCVICRKLRRPFSQQIMADLPADRVVPSPPFTIVGVDVFGPWNIVARRTRGGLAHSKRWAVLFSCLTSRAIHIEVIEELSSSAFINALARFISIRGAVKEFRSDRGTNFVGALDHINVDVIYVESGPVKKFLSTNGAKWTFNPPQTSHMAGSWERMIGIARKILDALLLNTKAKELTHEVLCTFMCEVTAIMNYRPICPISTAPEDPVIISPSMLLTQKDLSVDLMRVDFHNIKDMYVSQWKHVQYLSSMFWKRWRDEYLQNLQVRRKWQNNQPDLKTGDVVLMRDPMVHRGQWPLGIVTRVFPSQNDGKVRTVEVRIIRDGKRLTFVRPITELVLLID